MTLATLGMIALVMSAPLGMVSFAFSMLSPTGNEKWWVPPFIAMLVCVALSMGILSQFPPSQGCYYMSMRDLAYIHDAESCIAHGGRLREADGTWRQ